MLSTAHVSFVLPASHDADVSDIVAYAADAARDAFPNAVDVVAYDLDCAPTSLSAGAYLLELEITHAFSLPFSDAVDAFTINGVSAAGPYTLDAEHVAYTRV